jgi:hypothetical protein
MPHLPRTLTSVDVVLNVAERIDPVGGDLDWILAAGDCVNLRITCRCTVATRGTAPEAYQFAVRLPRIRFR